MLVDDEGGDLDEYASGLGQTCAGTELTNCRTAGTVQNEDYYKE